MQLRGTSARSAQQAGGREDDENSAGVLHPPCKSHLFAPSWWNASKSELTAPASHLTLDYVHGYRYVLGYECLSVCVVAMNGNYWNGTCMVAAMSRGTHYMYMR
jgi:hypothetical protein